MTRLMGAESSRIVEDGFDIGIRQILGGRDPVGQGRRRQALSHPGGRVGASSSGGLGYVGFAEEVRAQEAEMGLRFDYIIVCVVTGSTQAGMIVGLQAKDGRADRVIGIDGSGTRGADPRAGAPRSHATPPP